MAKSQGDIRKTIPAGGSVNIMARGEFVFLKKASARLVVTIHDEPVEMEAGDNRRVEQPFSSFEVRNVSGIDQKIELVVGFGDYSRLIVRGEISSFASLLGVDGVPRIDTRKKEVWDIGLIVPDEKSLQLFDPIGQLAVAPNTSDEMSAMGLTGYGNVLFVNRVDKRVRVFNAIDGLPLGSYSPPPPNNDIYVGPIQNHPTLGNLSVSNYLSAKVYRVGSNGYTLISEGEIPNKFAEITYFSDGGVLGYTGGTTKIIERFSSFVSQPEIVVEGAEAILGHGIGSVKADPFDKYTAIITGSSQSITIKRLNLQTLEVVDTGVPTSVAGNGGINYSYTMNRFYTFGGVQSTATAITELSKVEGDFFGQAMVVNAKSARFNSGVTSTMLRKTNQNHSYNEETERLTADIIRMIMDKKWQQSGYITAPVDYLDYVHSVGIDGQTVMDTGVISFARAEVADLFTVGKPSRVTIEFSNELEPR